MFGASEVFAKVLNEERMRSAECQGEPREWCRHEYRVEIRHG